MKRFRVLLVLVLVLALIPAGTALAKEPGGGTTTWVGEIDVNGDEVGDYDIVWWIELGPTWRTAGKASHYWMITEIWDGNTKLLATWEHGTTTSPNSTWRANGVVTEAYGVYSDWLGRNVHESGHFWLTAAGLAGESDFRLN